MIFNNFFQFISKQNILSFLVVSVNKIEITRKNLLISSVILLEIKAFQKNHLTLNGCQFTIKMREFKHNESGMD